MNETKETMTDDEMLRKLKTLSLPALVIVHIFIHALLFLQWLGKIPQRWVIFMMKLEARRAKK